ncbi:MAG TPA: protocatechuate 3,4-dioxygenase [Tepidisphaeraceae bacterium]|nr:protocatechuate 3,4-dioxygenase [Tepidisphaeraceae bacterium]
MADLTRRRFLSRTMLGTVAAATATTGLPTWALAEELVRTPRQTEGPFYPDRLPLDTDNDLLIVNDSITSAVGEVTHLTGRILDARGNPVRNAVVEIRQTDARGAYVHSESGNADRRDKHFQGFGRFLTGSTGEYYFRTIKPVPYPGRTPHIHFAIKPPGQERLTTQCYIKGHAQNAGDGVLRGVRDPRQRESVQVEFKPIPESKINELAARFDVVMGFTPSA